MKVATSVQRPYSLSPRVCTTKGIIRNDTTAAATRFVTRNAEPKVSLRAVTDIGQAAPIGREDARACVHDSGAAGGAASAFGVRQNEKSWLRFTFRSRQARSRAQGAA